MLQPSPPSAPRTTRGALSFRCAGKREVNRSRGSLTWLSDEMSLTPSASIEFLSASCVAIVFTSGRAGFTYSGLEATVRACTETPFRLPDRLECHSRLAPATRGDLCSGQQLKRGWRCVRPHLQALADERDALGIPQPVGSS